jgi:hypothetical protein
MANLCVKLRPITLAVAVTCFLTFIVAPLAVAVGFLILAPWDVSIPVTLGVVVLVALLGYGMSSSIHWVELDGSIIRGRRLFTRKLIELRVCDIVEAHGIRTQPMGPLENAVLDFMLQTRDPGFVLIFRDGTKIPLVKADMTGLAAFFGQLAAQIKCERTAAER